jgi:ethanolamine transporter EutH
MDIIRDGIFLAVYSFILITIYIFTSNPFTQIVTEFLALDAVGTEAKAVFNTVSTVYLFMFVLAGLIPIIWFIARAFQREPDWGYYQ